MFYRKACSLLVGCFWLINYGVFAQEQKVADSLVRIYQQNTLTDTAKFALLTDLSFHEIRDLNKGLQYAEELISLSQQTGNSKYLRVGYFLKGTKKRLLGNLDEALEAYFKSAEIAMKSHHLTAEGEAYGAIADIYSVADNHPNAMHYYSKAITALRQSNDSISLASAIFNAGDEFLKTQKYDSALLYFNEAKEIFDKVNYLSGRGYCLGNIGMVYANIGKNNLAEKNINEAIRILEETEDYYPICVYLVSMGEVYLNKGDNQTALTYTLKSLHLAEQHKLKEQIAAASLKLSELYDSAGNTKEAFKNYKRHIAYRDSVSNINSVKKMADLRTNYEISQKQIEVNLLTKDRELQQLALQRQKVIRNSLLAGITLFLVLAFVLFRNNRIKVKTNRLLILQNEQINHQKEELQSTLEDLKSTQEQLLQKEKAEHENELKLERLEKQQELASYQNRTAELEMQALRAQMNPHFIFNCLNSIDRFILKNESEAASDYLTKFSKLIRLILQNSTSKTVPLEKELEALRLYIEMEVLRFEDRFNYHISIDPDLEVEDLEVPPLIIQPYVENAIWHGLMHKQDKGHLTINLHRENDILCCQITDDGVGRKRAAELKSKSASKNKSLGIQITSHRLELINTLNEKECTVEITDLVDASGEACGTRVVLKIPV